MRKPARPWTSDEVAILRRMTTAGYADQEIGRHLKRTKSAVTYRRLVLGIEPGTSIEARRILARVQFTRSNPRHRRAA